MTMLHSRGGDTYLGNLRDDGYAILCEKSMDMLETMNLCITQPLVAVAVDNTRDQIPCHSSGVFLAYTVKTTQSVYGMPSDQEGFSYLSFGCRAM